MKAVVVCESLWGNTAAIARAIASGIGPDAKSMYADEATPEVLAGADLIVAGAPLLGFKLPDDAMRKSIASNPKEKAADLSHPSIRSWLATVPPGGRCAAFETRIWWSPGSAAKTIAESLAKLGYEPAAPAEKFMVTGRYGPLKDGEVDRAKAWGAELAKAAEPGR
jgi:flavodoxin